MLKYVFMPIIGFMLLGLLVVAYIGVSIALIIACLSWLAWDYKTFIVRFKEHARYKKENEINWRDTLFDKQFYLELFNLS